MFVGTNQGLAKACLDAAAGFVRHPEQPLIKLRLRADGIEIWRTWFAKAGMLVPQHAHTFDHLSMLSAGSARVWADGEDLGIVRAPEGRVIRAGVKHRFDILEDGTIVDCIHYVGRTGTLAVSERHELVGVALDLEDR